MFRGALYSVSGRVFAICAVVVLRPVLEGYVLQRYLLAADRKQAASREMLLWMTPSEAPKALQASECSELLDPLRASCRIPAQH